MSDRPTFTGIVPYLRYPDGDAAVAWLTSVFGFGPARRVPGPDGGWAEGRLGVGSAHVDVSGGHPLTPDTGAGFLLIVMVGDVDALADRIRAAGVEVGSPRDEPYGPRVCDATDPWGYRWYFWQGEAAWPEPG